MSGSQGASRADAKPRHGVLYPPLPPMITHRPWTIPSAILDDAPKVEPEPLTLSTESLTVQMARWKVNKQEDSILFTMLPLEVRQCIFSLVFVQEHFIRKRPQRNDPPVAQPRQHDSDFEYDSDAEDDDDPVRVTPAEAALIREHISLPTRLDPRELHAVRNLRQHTALLRTCRLAFCEARDLLMKMTTWRWVDGPDGFLYQFMHSDRGTRDMSPRCMTRHTANRITSFHAFVQSSSFDSEFIFNRILDMCPARDLTIAIRQHDWDDMPCFAVPVTPYKLELDPYADGSCGMANQGLSPMRQHMWETADFGWDKPTRPRIPPIDFPTGPTGTRPWAEAIAMLPRLERLTVVLEHCEDNLLSLQNLVSWAHRVWSFRLGGHMKGYYLSAEDTPILEKVWRGDPNQWSKDWHEGHVEPPANAQRRLFCDGCARRDLLRETGLGPRMYSYTINFTAHPLRPEDGDSAGVAGPDTLGDAWVEPPNDVLPPGGRSELRERTLSHELLHPTLQSFKVMDRLDMYGSVADLIRARDYYQEMQESRD